jgi:hypothetical protein
MAVTLTTPASRTKIVDFQPLPQAQAVCCPPAGEEDQA